MLRPSRVSCAWHHAVFVFGFAIEIARQSLVSAVGKRAIAWPPVELGD